MIPTLDLHGFKHEEVENEVARFLSLWMGKNLFADIITGHSETMSNLVLQVVTAYGCIP
jgi:DNA-nicking Smr family endonuclease